MNCLTSTRTPRTSWAKEACSGELSKAVIERCLETELDTHLGYPKHGRKGKATGNSRNGQSQKTLKAEQGHIDIEVPRDRHSTFEPQLVKKGQTRLEGTDRENPGVVGTGNDHARHTGATTRPLGSGGVTGAHFQRD
jgi:transposase-like protein